MTRRVGCAWIAEWLRARETGDDRALERATAALSSSHQWQVLHRMDDEGNWPEWFREIADDVAAGKLPAGHAQELDCA